MTPKKPLTQKQIEKEEERLRKVMEDFDEVWGDDLDYLDLFDELTQNEKNISSKNPDGKKLPS
tara:strand:+ start:1933 stop:2121 length:189 start_codon:yes stop_codon:yes gene_type:complete